MRRSARCDPRRRESVSAHVRVYRIYFDRRVYTQCVLVPRLFSYGDRLETLVAFGMGQVFYLFIKGSDRFRRRDISFCFYFQSINFGRAKRSLFVQKRERTERLNKLFQPLVPVCAENREIIATLWIFDMARCCLI